MNIEDIADFITLAETGSFSKAASARRVTQPAFSRRIKTLEDQMEAQLFRRDTQPVSLTAAGEKFLSYARSVSELMKKATEDVQSAATSLRNPVHIVMPHSLSVSFFPIWYKALRRKHTDISIRISHESVSKSIAELRKGLADFAIIIMAKDVDTCFDLDDLEDKPIGSDRLCAVRVPHLPKSEHQQILAYKHGSYMDECAQLVLDKNGVGKAKPVFETSSGDLLRTMALTGFGTAILQESLIEDDLLDGFLVPAFKKDFRLECSIRLVRLKNKLRPHAEKLWKTAI